MKGLIALDIDGTVTPPGQPIAWEVVRYLQDLAKDRWQFLFVTGRTFQFGYQVLNQFPFQYYYGVQNGAIILNMPSQTIVSKKYLQSEIIPAMERICSGRATDFIIYAGYEHQDICYFRSHCFSEELRDYLAIRTKKFKETWIDVPTFDNLDIDAFASVKCFGDQSSAKEIASLIEQELGLHVPLIRDVFNPAYFVAQATHPSVNKGEAVKQLTKLLNPKVVIAAGDDYNDLTMLSAADIKVVMSTAPSDMLGHADVIAPSAEDHGLIAGLKYAIAMAEAGQHR